MKKRFIGILTLLSLVFSLLLTACAPAEPISLDDIPEYSGNAYIQINGNTPFFTDEEITASAFEDYSPLDPLGRCGVATACVGTETMPTEDRGEISSVTPSGWEIGGKSNNKQYYGEYLYNRCHLIGHQLTGEDANDKNLITGTRYLNIEGMLPFENQIADYVKETTNHVMYRVTPMFDGNNLVASGVLMEGLSVEDGGEGIYFCVYAYNVQPGVEINYFNGSNRKSGDTSTDLGATDGEQPTSPTDGEVTYILNTSSKKYHLPDESCTNNIKESNRGEYTGTKENFTSQYPDYKPCGTCEPHEN